MAEDTPIPKALASLRQETIIVYREDRTVADMSATAANAAIQVATQTHGVPAKEETKRAAIGALVILVGLGIAAAKLTGGALAWTLVGLATVMGAWGIVGRLTKKKPD